MVLVMDRDSMISEIDPVPIASGAVVGILAAFALAFVAVVWRKKLLCFRQKKPSLKFYNGLHNSGYSTNDDVELSDKRRERPVKLSNIAEVIERMFADSKMQFSKEFEDLSQLSPKHPTKICNLQENRAKNRYTNILPFDHSLVKLKVIENDPFSDFINANFIPGFNSPKEFIATQGPLPATLPDFWRMIWEHNVSLIVMVTQIMERGRKKCELYWPEEIGEEILYGDVGVKIETESFLNDYALRTITLRVGDQYKKVRHFNYLAWPDMGTPKTTKGMMDFVSTIRKEVRPNMKGPIVVHCSAGVGRTGTFIVMDKLMQQLQNPSKSTVDIFGAILQMRNNRCNMVQTEEQYVFIYKCIRDLVNAPKDEEKFIDEESPYENWQQQQ